MAACLSGHTAIVKELVSRGAGINDNNANGNLTNSNIANKLLFVYTKLTNPLSNYEKALLLS